jgi:ATP-dependent Clp protease ATP-binding subunit ClpA
MFETPVKEMLGTAVRLSLARRRHVFDGVDLLFGLLSDPEGAHGLSEAGITLIPEDILALVKVERSDLHRIVVDIQQPFSEEALEIVNAALYAAWKDDLDKVTVRHILTEILSLSRGEAARLLKKYRRR